MPESPFFRPGRGKPSRNSPCPQIPDPDSHVPLMICPYFLLFSAPSFSSITGRIHTAPMCVPPCLSAFSPSSFSRLAAPIMRSRASGHPAMRLPDTCCQFLFTEIQEPHCPPSTWPSPVPLLPPCRIPASSSIVSTESLKTSTDPHSPVTEKQYSAPHA